MENHALNTLCQCFHLLLNYYMDMDWNDLFKNQELFHHNASPLLSGPIAHSLWSRTMWMWQCYQSWYLWSLLCPGVGGCLSLILFVWEWARHVIKLMNWPDNITWHLKDNRTRLSKKLRWFHHNMMTIVFLVDICLLWLNAGFNSIEMILDEMGARARRDAGPEIIPDWERRGGQLN